MYLEPKFSTFIVVASHTLWVLALYFYCGIDKNHKLFVCLCVENIRSHNTNTNILCVVAHITKASHSKSCAFFREYCQRIAQNKHTDIHAPIHGAAIVNYVDKWLFLYIYERIWMSICLFGKIPLGTTTGYNHRASKKKHLFTSKSVVAISLC